MHKHLLVIFSLLFSSSTLALLTDDAQEFKSPSQSSPYAGTNAIDSFPETSETAEQPTGSCRLDPLDKEDYIIVESEILQQSIPGIRVQSLLGLLRGHKIVRFSNKEERAWIQTNIGILYC